MSYTDLFGEKRRPPRGGRRGTGRSWITCVVCGEWKELHGHKKCRRCYQASPDVKRRQREAQARFRATPKGKQYFREYNQRPDVKRRQREAQARFRASPKGKQKIREAKARYLASPKGKQTLREYFERPDVKRRQREYRADPDNRQRAREAEQRYGRSPKGREVRRKRWAKVGGRGHHRHLGTLILRQQFRCAWPHCEINGGMLDGDSTVDHIIPQSRWSLFHGGPAPGLNDLANLQAMHRSCNSAKGAKLPGEY